MNELLGRQPIHVVYGGAQLFKAETCSKIGELARKSFELYAGDVSEFASAFELVENELIGKVYERVKAKLKNEPVEDYRIDFEDGFGYRTDAEEDEAAINCAKETAIAVKGDLLPEYFGIRVKPYSGEFGERSFRTLSIYLRELLSHTSGELPKNFLLTFPKIETAGQVDGLTTELSKVEKTLSLPEGSLHIEIMVETAKSLLNQEGQFALQLIAKAGNGRIRAAHFGAFDFTAELGIISKYQTLQHQSCDFARNIMKVSLEGTGIRLSDGATNVMPIGPHRNELLSKDELDANIAVIHKAWKLHFDNIMHSLQNGFYQGWDLHPAQLIPRFAATYLFFAENLKESSERLSNFLARAARSTLHANVFDDAASGQGLLNFFIRGYNCGAISKDEILNAGITVEELKLRSFSKIISSRKVNQN
jgi:citrate lyase beta subunit